MNEVTIGIVGLVIVLIMFLTGIELAFAMILMGFLGFGYLISWNAAFNLLAKDFYDVLNSYSKAVRIENVIKIFCKKIECRIPRYKIAEP